MLGPRPSRRGRPFFASPPFVPLSQRGTCVVRASVGTRHHAADLLTRDVKNLCGHFAKLAVRRDPDEISRRLWTAFLFAEL
jgi:hypothetical protein